MKKKKVAELQLTKDELEVLVYIIDDWQWWKSDEHLIVSYPNHSITSTKLLNLFNRLYNKLPY